MAKTILVRDSTQVSGSQQSFTNAAAIADLNLGVPVLLADVIADIALLQTKLNAILAALRTVGVIAP